MDSFLSEISLFKGVHQKELEGLGHEAISKQVPQDELIFRAGDSADFLYVLKKGLVKLFNVRKGTSKEEIVCWIRPGGYFCLAPLLSREKLHIHARAAQPSELIALPKKAILDLMERSHPFTRNIVKALACKECELCEEVCDLSLSTTKERLAKHLLGQFELNSRKPSFRLSMNQSELASSLGTVRETLSRDLAALKKARIIETKQGKISVLNAKELETLARKRIATL